MILESIIELAVGMGYVGAMHSEGEKITAKGLAEAMDCDSKATSSFLKRLKQLGYVVSLGGDPAIYQLTEEGLDLVKLPEEEVEPNIDWPARYQQLFTEYTSVLQGPLGIGGGVLNDNQTYEKFRGYQTEVPADSQKKAFDGSDL